MNNENDMRQEYRLATQQTVFLEVGHCDEANITQTDIVISNSLDISANGLQINIDRKLPVGSIHQTCVQLDEPDCRLQLITEVKWCKPAEEEGDYLIGLSLFESEGTDIKRWKEVIADRCLNSQ